MAKTKILFVDDHPAFAKNLEHELNQDPRYELLVAQTAEDARDLIKQHRPAVAIVDLQLDGSRMNGIELTDWIAQQVLGTRVLIFSGRSDRWPEAASKGAYGFVHKSHLPRVLIDALPRVLAGEPVELLSKMYGPPPVGVLPFTYEFAGRILDCAKPELTVRGQVKRVDSTVLDLIEFLLKNAGRVVTHAELFEQLFFGAAKPDALKKRVSEARLALEDTQNPLTRRWTLIQTQRKKGFQLGVAVNKDFSVFKTREAAASFDVSGG